MLQNRISKRLTSINAIELNLQEAEHRLQQSQQQKISFQMQAQTLEAKEAEAAAARDLQAAEERLRQAAAGSEERKRAALDLCLFHGVVEDDGGIEKRNGLGETPLVTACADGEREYVCYLLVAGANVEASNTHGQSPLFETAFHGHIECLVLLLQHGADVNRRDSKSGMSALLVAAMEGGPACAQHSSVLLYLRDRRGNSLETETGTETENGTGRERE